MCNFVVRNGPEQNVPWEDAFEVLGNSGPIRADSFHRAHKSVAFHFPRSCG